MNTTRMILVSILILIVGIGIGLSLHRSLGSLQLNAGGLPTTTLTTSQVQMLNVLGVASRVQAYPSGQRPKMFIPLLNPQYTASGLLESLQVRNLADIKATQLKSCVNDETNSSLADCLLALINTSAGSVDLPVYALSGTATH